MEPCPLCSPLRDTETSFYKYAASEYDRPLPAAAARLTILPAAEGEESDKHHIRRCPHCAALFDYRLTYEYHCNGSEDEETLSRLTDTEAEAWRRAWVRDLETLRRQVEGLYDRAGSLGDYIDRGHPEPGDRLDALDEMQRCRKEAGELREKLTVRLDQLRREAPEVLAQWVDLHIRVCRSYLEAESDGSDDAGTLRYVAQTTLEAWQALTEPYIPVNTAWLEDYPARWDQALDSPGVWSRNSP